MNYIFTTDAFILIMPPKNIEADCGMKLNKRKMLTELKKRNGDCFLEY